MSSFIHLRNHSQYSILDATPSIKDLVKKCQNLQMESVALTDHANLFGAVEFYKECQDQGIKPIIGTELYVAPTNHTEKRKLPGMRAAYNLTLLAKNNQGYKNLCKLSSLGYLQGFYYFPRVDIELLEQYKEGVIAIFGGMGSLLAHQLQQEGEEAADQCLDSYLKIYQGSLYLDLQRHQMSEEQILADKMTSESWLVQAYREYNQKQQKLNEYLINISHKKNVPIVATNDVHYLDREDWRSHEVLLNIGSGEPCEIWEKNSQGILQFKIPNPKRSTYASHEHYFKTEAEMQTLFADQPASLNNTKAISDLCHVEIDFKTKHYPIFIPPKLEQQTYSKEEQKKAVEEFLWQLCRDGISKRYDKAKLAKVQEVYPDQDPLEVVQKRLKYEMDIIVPKEMADYLLIVWDFINWAKKNQIPMGPGRGSGAGSIVLYLIGITDIEPLRFNLFFERFINPERLSYPDIDVDICMEKRGQVIAYTLQKYGQDNVAQIITFGTMKAKMALKDVGRTISVPLSKVNQLAKLVPDDLNITLDKALEKEPELQTLYDTDEEVAKLFDLAKKLEGSIRNTGVHAAGIIISGQPLTDLIPLANAKDSTIPVTQFSMKPVESVGMLKVDFLGLKTLTAIQICVDSINLDEKIDWVNLPLDNQKTFELINQGKTAGIFQLESSGMQDLARQLHLDKFEEIIAVGALYRPGPMDMIPSFINRKHGREEIENDHPWMKDILSETYGIMVYQEQVMQIASKLANYTLGEGDVLRRAMGKKDMAQMAKQREKFKLGALENGISAEISMKIFDKMEKFASYGFNKSHAAAYGYLSYVTAYLKANYPKEWMAALMTCDRDDLSKIAKFIRDCQAMNIPILPPDINEAKDIFQATSTGIRFAMTGIKGVGSAVVENILAEKQANGPFESLYNFFERVDSKKVGKKAVENLVEAGCFDFTGWTREELVCSIEAMHDVASREQKEKKLGIQTFFSLLGEESSAKFEKPPEIKKPRSKIETLQKEKELLGFFLTGHPMDEYKKILQRLSCVPLRRIDTLIHDAVFRSAFIVESMQVRFSSKTNKKFAILNISDGLARFELPIWPELYEKSGHLLRENQLLYAVLQVDKSYADEAKLNCRWVDDLTKADEAMIEECDKAYNRAKQMTIRFGNRNNKPTAKVEKKEEKKMISAKFKVDTSKARLSDILKIQELIQQNLGPTAVELHFYKANIHTATLYLDVNQGINLSSNFTAELQKIDCISALNQH